MLATTLVLRGPLNQNRYILSCFVRTCKDKIKTFLILIFPLQVISERDILGTQLVRRNDELALLYEKIKIQQSTLNKGEV